MKLLSFFQGHLWKVATIGAGVISLILVSLLIASTFENRDLSNARAVLASRIDDPKTGYVAQLAQARTNEETLKLVVKRQNEAYTTLSAKSKSDLALTEAALVVAQRETKLAESRLAAFLATKPQGATLEARVRDIDERALAELIK